MLECVIGDTIEVSVTDIKTVVPVPTLLKKKMPGSTDLLRMAPDVSGSEFERKLIYYTPLFTVVQEYSEFTVQHRLKSTAADIDLFC